MSVPLIVNLNHELNLSMLAPRCRCFSRWWKRPAGDATACRLVDAYHHRPAVELYDLKTDPLEMTNAGVQVVKRIIMGYAPSWRRG